MDERLDQVLIIANDMLSLASGMVAGVGFSSWCMSTVVCQETFDSRDKDGWFPVQKYLSPNQASAVSLPQLQTDSRLVWFKIKSSCPFPTQNFLVIPIIYASSKIFIYLACATSLSTYYLHTSSNPLLLALVKATMQSRPKPCTKHRLLQPTTSSLLLGTPSKKDGKMSANSSRKAAKVEMEVREI